MAKREVMKFDKEICLVGLKYYYRGTPEGTKKRIEISLGLEKGALQRDILRVKKEKLEKYTNTGRRHGKNTIAAVGKAYIADRRDECDNDELAPRSFYESKTIVEKHLIPYFENLRIEELDQEKFDGYCIFKKRVGGLKKKKVAINLVNHRKVTNHLLKWAVSKNYLKMRPELVIPKKAKKARRERPILTDSQILRLVAAAKELDNGRVLAYLLLYGLMGVRNQEICKLRWDQVSFENRSLQIDRLSNRVRKPRIIPINQYVLTLLIRMKAESRSDWVFPSRTKNAKLPHLNPVGGIRKAWNRVQDRAAIGVRVQPHDMRAQFERFMAMNKEFTDTQREKMAGAAIDVQKQFYVSMNADHLRGLEESVQIEGLDEMLGGVSGGETQKKTAPKGLTQRKKAGL